MMDLMKLFSAQKKFSFLSSQFSIRKSRGFSFARSQSGFTLIELLVVIGILGILAAALVATIDPFEQLKKADDSKIKNMAVEFQTANVRYYTTHGAFPWNDLSGNGTCTAAPLDATFTGATVNLNTGAMLGCINGASNSLISEGELKDAFDSVPTDLAKVKVSWDSTDATNMYVCFAPTSKSQKSAPETAYDSAGQPLNGCPAVGNPLCHWCTR